MEELTWRERGRLWFRLGLRLVLAVTAALLIWKVGLPLLSLLMPFVLALCLAWLLNPVIRLLQKKLNVRRGVLSLLLVLLVIAVVGGLLAGLIYTLIAQVISFLQNWQTAWSDTMSGLNAITGFLEDFLHPLPEETYRQITALVDKATEWISTVVPQLLTLAASHAGAAAMSLPSFGVGVIVFIMATYLISADYPHLRFKASQRVPEDFRGFASQVKHMTTDAFGGYVRAEVILSVVVFFILLIGYFIMGEPYALLLAFVLAVMDFIPIIGAGTVMVPWAVIDVALGNFKHAIGLMVIWGIIVVFRRLAEPKVVGDQTGLSPIASLVSIYVGMRLGGVVGMVLGPILCLVLLNLARSGLFDNTAADVRLAVRDLGAIFKAGAEEKK